MVLLSMLDACRGFCLVFTRANRTRGFARVIVRTSPGADYVALLNFTASAVLLFSCGLRRNQYVHRNFIENDNIRNIKTTSIVESKVCLSLYLTMGIFPGHY